MLTKRFNLPRSFQPTPSARRVTAHDLCPGLIYLISTHTLRKEGDPYAHRRAGTS